MSNYYPIKNWQVTSYKEGVVKLFQLSKINLSLLFVIKVIPAWLLCKTRLELSKYKPWKRNDAAIACSIFQLNSWFFMAIHKKRHLKMFLKNLFYLGVMYELDF